LDAFAGRVQLGMKSPLTHELSQRDQPGMSALTPKAATALADRRVRQGPKADIAPAILTAEEFLPPESTKSKSPERSGLQPDIFLNAALPICKTAVVDVHQSSETLAAA
jgi:hypothetical protein